MTSLSNRHNIPNFPKAPSTEEQSSFISYAERDRAVMKMLKRGSQNYNVYIYLRNTGSLTVDEWYQISNTTTLTQRINQLKKYGADIKNVYEDDNDKNYARYALNKD